MNSPETEPLKIEAEPLLRPELQRAERLIGLVCLSLGVTIEEDRNAIDDQAPPPSPADGTWPVYFLEGLYKAVLYNYDLQNWLSGCLDDVASQPPSDQLIQAQDLYLVLAKELGNGAGDMRSHEMLVSRHQPPTVRRSWWPFSHRP